MIRSNRVNLGAYYFNMLYINFLVIYILLYTIVPFNHFMSFGIWKLLNYGMGLFAVFYNVFANFCFKKIRWYPLLLLFIGSYAVTILINYKNGYFQNLQELYYMVVFYLIVLSLGGTRDKTAIKRLFVLSGSLVVFIFTVSMLWSIFMFLNGYGEAIVVDGRTVYQGFNEARLFGVFSDPNYASVNAITALLISLILIYLTKKKFFKFSLYLCVLIQFIFIVLANSRTSRVTFFFVLIIGAWWGLKEKYGIKKGGVRVLSGTLFLVLAIALLWRTATFVLPVLAEGIQNVKTVEEPMPSYQYGNNTEGSQESVITLEREDTHKKDISNNRFTIWMSALEVFQSHPFMGTGFAYMTEVGKTTNPDTYIVQRGYSLHNGYLDILVSSGLSGFIIMMSFFLFTFIEIVNKILRIDAQKRYQYILVLLIPLSIAIGHLALSGLCYSSTASTFLFWLYLGFAISISENYLE